MTDSGIRTKKDTFLILEPYKKQQEKQMAEFPEIIKIDDVLELRHLAPTFENAKMFFDAIDNDREHLEQWLGWVSKRKNAEDCYNSLKKIDDKRANGTGYEWAIFYKGEFVGYTGFHTINEKNRTLESGSFLIKKAEGKGIHSRIKQELEKMVFSDDFWNKIIIICDAKNVRSANGALRNGYIQEACLREDSRDINGNFKDSLMFGKLRSDWERELKNA
jgi:ribosomal-protein-serine acetyltransferase